MKEMYQCDNFENEKCRYFQMLQGTGEDLPTGCDSSNGDCLAIQECDDWNEVEEEDCDMADLGDMEDEA